MDVSLWPLHRNTQSRTHIYTQMHAYTQTYCKIQKCIHVYTYILPYNTEMRNEQERLFHMTGLSIDDIIIMEAIKLSIKILNAFKYVSIFFSYEFLIVNFKI